jgi:endo-1,4-beta-D-glucanase Y
VKRSRPSHAGAGILRRNRTASAVPFPAAVFAALFLAALLLAPSSRCRAQQPWPLWNSYVARFLDGQGRVIDHTSGDRTTTEGEAYAMFFALAAGDRPHFDKLLDWTEANLAQGDLTLHLPAWSWGKAADGSWRILDPNPAADADLWMAYSLCEAGRLWHSVRYEKLGGIMADRIAQQEIVLVPGVGTTLLPGTIGFHPDEHTWYLNASYMPPSLLVYFSRRRPQSSWSEVVASLPILLKSNGGFVMDWVTAGDHGVQPALAPSAGDQDHRTSVPVGSYDAIRAYLWIGMADPHTPGLQACLQQMSGMAAYLGTHLTPPLTVDASGKALNPDGPPGFSAAVIPYLHTLGRKQEERVQADRLDALKDPQSGLFGRGADYYDQSLALFGTGWAEGRIRFEASGRLKARWS